MAHAIQAGHNPAIFRHCTQAQPLDPGRITATSAAIALHAVVLMVLLTPTALPPMPEARPEMEIVIPIEPMAVPPPKPEQVDVAPEPRTVPPQSTRQPAPDHVVAPPDTPMTTPEPGDLPAPPEVSAFDPGPTVDAMPDLSPMTGARLAYASAPPPKYPARAVRDGRTGTVLLEVTVDVDGSPLEVAISRSSGHRDLDRAARRQVLSRWHFQPAMRDGHPVRAIGLVPVEFKL